MTPIVYAIIPARAGSKGVPDKNIRAVCGYPLLAYSIAAAKLTMKIDRVFVSTDSADYAEIALSYGAEAPFLRPESIANDRAGDIDVMRHFLDWLNESKNESPQFLVHLRPTTPVRDPSIIDSAIDSFMQYPNATALRSVHEMAETAYKTVEMKDGFLATAFTLDMDLEAANAPRQIFPKTYSPNGYVDVLKVSMITEQARLHGDRVLGFLTPPVTEIDRPEDLEFLEFELKKNSELVDRLFENFHE